MDAIGKLAVILTGDSKSFNKMINAARKDLNQFAGDVGEVGRNVAGAGAAMVLPLVASVKRFIDEGDRIAKHAQMIGVTAEEYQGLAHAANLAGAEIADVEKAVQKAARAQYDAARGSKEQKDALSQIGLSPNALSGKSPVDSFLSISAALGQVEDDSKQAALAQVLLGKSASALIPFMEQETAAIREQMAEGARLTGLSNEQALAAERLNDEWGRATAAAKGAALQLGAALAPAAEQATRRAKEMALAFADWVRANPATVNAYAKAATSLLAIGTGLLAVERGAKVARAALTGISLTRKGIVSLAGSVKSLYTSTMALGGIGVVAVSATAIGVAALGAVIRDHLKEISRLQDQIRKNAGAAVPGEGKSLAALEYARKNLQMQQEQTQNEKNEQGWWSNTFGAGATLEAEYSARAEQIAELDRRIEQAREAEKAAAEAAKPAETQRQASAIEAMTNALQGEYDALTLTTSQLQRKRLAALGATDAEIAHANAMQASVNRMQRLRNGVGDVAREAEALARSYSNELATMGMAPRAAELMNMQARVAEARQKTLAAAMDGVTGAAYEQAAAQVAAAEAALEGAKAASKLLDEEEAAEAARAKAEANRGKSAWSDRPAWLEWGSREAYSLRIGERGGGNKGVEQNTSKTAKMTERTARATEKMAGATGTPTNPVDLVDFL